MTMAISMCTGFIGCNQGEIGTGFHNPMPHFAQSKSLNDSFNILLVEKSAYLLPLSLRRLRAKQVIMFMRKALLCSREKMLPNNL
jgi:hypothetical protein